jgi:hypothetical protein
MDITDSPDPRKSPLVSKLLWCNQRRQQRRPHLRCLHQLQLQVPIWPLRGQFNDTPSNRFGGALYSTPSLFININTGGNTRPPSQFSLNPGGTLFCATSSDSRQCWRQLSVPPFQLQHVEHGLKVGSMLLIPQKACDAHDLISLGHKHSLLSPP